MRIEKKRVFLILKIGNLNVRLLVMRDFTRNTSKFLSKLALCVRIFLSLFFFLLYNDKVVNVRPLYKASLYILVYSNISTYTIKKQRQLLYSSYYQRMFL